MSQTNNINFNIHEETEVNSYTRESIFSILLDGVNNSDNPLNILEFLSYIFLDLEDIYTESLFESNNLEKKDIKLDVSGQKYYTVQNKIDKCSICLNNYEETEMVCILNNCKHMFHLECIMEWGKYKQECPMCRENISYIDLNS